MKIKMLKIFLLGQAQKSDQLIKFKGNNNKDKNMCLMLPKYG